MSATPISYTNPRSGKTYEVHLDTSGFSPAIAAIPADGSEPQRFSVFAAFMSTAKALIERGDVDFLVRRSYWWTRLPGYPRQSLAELLAPDSINHRGWGVE